MMDLDGTEAGGSMTLTPLGLSASPSFIPDFPLAVSWHTTLTGVGNPQPLLSFAPLSIASAISREHTLSGSD